MKLFLLTTFSSLTSLALTAALDLPQLGESKDQK